jgi:PAS domain S-box-containing protein
VGILVVAAVIAAQALWILRLYRHSSEREELFRIIAENAADMIALVNVKGRRLYNSPAYQKVLGYSAAELGATSVFEQIHPDDRERVLAASRQAKETGIGKSLEYRLRHKDGHWLTLESSASTIRNSRGEVEKLVIVNRDITQRKQAEETLAHHALHDALTGLANRRLFLDRLERCFLQAQRDPKFQYALLFVDLDAFKVLNDTRGTSVGDQMLAETGRRLENCLREADTVSRPLDEFPGSDVVLSRMGGDEFTVLLEGISDSSDAMRVAQRIEAALTLPLTLPGGPVSSSVSIGIAVHTQTQERPEDILRDAETALRRAKALGGARSELFDPMLHTRAVNRLKLEEDLREAIRLNQFRVFYQPVVEITNPTMSGSRL